jgi:Flp pilus assembly protein TadG
MSEFTPQQTRRIANPQVLAPGSQVRSRNRSRRPGLSAMTSGAAAHPAEDRVSEIERCTMNDILSGSSQQTAGTMIRTVGARLRSFMDRMRVRRGDGESGQAMIEMAFVAPVILLVLTGICSFGIAMNQYQLLTYGTANAARAFALSRNQSSWTPTAAGDPCEYSYDIATGAMPTLNTSNLTVNITFTPPSGADNSAQTWNNVTGSSGCSTFALDGTDINGTVNVTATYPVYPLLWGWTHFQLTLTATTMQQIQ